MQKEFKKVIKKAIAIKPNNANTGYNNDREDISFF